jgi:hypothetical protein
MSEWIDVSCNARYGYSHRGETEMSNDDGWVAVRVDHLKEGDEVMGFGYLSAVWPSPVSDLVTTVAISDYSTMAWPSHAVVQVRVKPKRWRISFETSDASRREWWDRESMMNREPYSDIIIEAIANERSKQ